MKWMLAAIFVSACALQALIWSEHDIIDGNVWAAEAQYVEMGNPLQFEGGAYGYPAGPIIDGTILVHTAARLSYYDSLFAFLTIFDGLIIALACSVAYTLRRNPWWVAALAVLLPLDPMFEHSTPTTAAASLTAVLISLLALFLYERRSDPRMSRLLLAWGIAAGVFISIRADIGGLLVLAFGLLLASAYGIKKLVWPAVAAMTAFALFDPFLWSIPVRHIADLFGRMAYHYFEYAPVHVPLSEIAILSLMTVLSALFALASLRPSANTSVPRQYILVLIVVSVIIYVIFLTARSQALRYFQPVIFVWEALLPLYLLQAVDEIRFPFASQSARSRAALSARIAMFALLAGYPIVTFYIWWIQ